jgi:hypothetical protein
VEEVEERARCLFVILTGTFRPPLQAFKKNDAKTKFDFAKERKSEREKKKTFFE